MIIQNNQLTVLQLQQFDKLYDICQKVDQGSPAIYRSLLAEERLSKNNVLYYDNSVLIGFLSVYFFYENACEISVLVHPTHRRQKIATQLLQQIIPLLITNRIEQVIFSTPQFPIPTDHWLSDLGFHYLESEYHMERVDTKPVPMTSHLLDIRRAQIDDIPILAQLDQICFAANSQFHSQIPFASLLYNPDYLILVAHYLDSPIGKAQIHWQKKGPAFLSDIAILPSFQKQGFGSELIAYTINEALKHSKTTLALDVATNNRSKAFNVYQRYGFKTTSQVDYWTIPFHQLYSK